MIEGVVFWANHLQNLNHVSWLIRVFPGVWYRSHVFPALCVSVFPHLAMVARFPALGTGCKFSRAWHWLHVFPRLEPVACFSRVWHRLYVFSRLSQLQVACFPALGAGFPFSRTSHCFYLFSCYHRLRAFALSSDWFVLLFIVVVTGQTL